MLEGVRRALEGVWKEAVIVGVKSWRGFTPAL